MQICFVLDITSHVYFSINRISSHLLLFLVRLILTKNFTLAAIVQFGIRVRPKVDSNQKEVAAKDKFCSDFFLIFLTSVYTLAMLARGKISDFFRTQSPLQTLW